MRSRAAALSLALATLAVAVAGWKAYVSLADVSRFVLPPPEDVVRALGEILAEGRTWNALGVTALEIALGFSIATTLGVAIGLAVGSVRLLDRAYTPFLIAFQVLPKIAIVPLLLLWLGFGISSRVAVAAMFSLLPIALGARAGVRGVEPGHRDLAAVLQASRWQRLRLVELPGALPSILTGMEIGIVLATIGAVVTEYLAGSDGLGWLAITSLNQLRVDRLFAVIVVLVLLGVACYGVVAALRRLLVPWHPSAALPGLALRSRSAPPAEPGEAVPWSAENAGQPLAGEPAGRVS